MSAPARMRIQILDAQHVVRLETVLDASATDLVERQLALCTDDEQKMVFLERLQRAVGAAVVDSVQYDLKPPTRAQIEYATVIAAALSVALPPEVLRFRGHMHVFLDSYVADYRAAKDARRSVSGVQPPSRNGEPDDRLPF